MLSLQHRPVCETSLRPSEGRSRTLRAVAGRRTLRCRQTAAATSSVRYEPEWRLPAIWRAVGRPAAVGRGPGVDAVGTSRPRRRQEEAARPERPAPRTITSELPRITDVTADMPARPTRARSGSVFNERALVGGGRRRGRICFAVSSRGVLPPWRGREGSRIDARRNLGGAGRVELKSPQHRLRVDRPASAATADF
jgi:hypothetical protein